MSISIAVGNERISKVVGYSMTGADFSNVTSNLPQRIAVLGEANAANQSNFVADEGVEVTTLKAVGDKFGYGSPIYNMVRIMKPSTSDGVGGIPIIVYPQVEGLNVAKAMTLTVVGTPTENVVHYVTVAGRESIDGDSYAVNLVTTDTVTTIASKITDAINNALGCPFTATSALGVVTVVSKWKGLTADDLGITVNINDIPAGLTYATLSTVSGVGTPTVTAALTNFGNDWNTIVVNSYGIDATGVMTELEAFNGKPDPVTPTGRYAGIIMKPFIALTGSVKGAGVATDTTITEAKKDQLTIAVCPAQLSAGLPMEAAANMCVLFARQSQDNPHLDVSGMNYPDMPIYDGIIPMSVYDTRDQYVKKGHTTIEIVAGRYKVMDFVTTYHPVGEQVPQYRYCRSLTIDYNVRFGYFLLEEINVVDHAIASDDDIVLVDKVIKPKDWVGIINNYADDLGSRMLITEVSFMKNNITVGLSNSNPNRLESFFRYKRSGFARVLPTTAEAGFNFGG